MKNLSLFISSCFKEMIKIYFKPSIIYKLLTLKFPFKEKYHKYCLSLHMNPNAKCNSWQWHHSIFMQNIHHYYGNQPLHSSVYFFMINIYLLKIKSQLDETLYPDKLLLLLVIIYIDSYGSTISFKRSIE